MSGQPRFLRKFSWKGDLLGALKGIYPHANTIVSIEDSKLLKQYQYNILFNAKGLQKTLDELNRINYFQTYKNADMHNFGVVLDLLMKNTFDLMRNISPVDTIWRMFALYYDIHNLKLVVKEKFFGKRFDHLALDYGSYSLPTIRSAAVKESDNILNNGTLTKGFFEALQTKEMYDIDFILDKTYFKSLKRLAEELGVYEIVTFVTERIDFYNISMFFQFLAVGRPYGYFQRAFSDQGSYPLEEWLKYVNGGLDEIQNFPMLQNYKHIWENAESRHELLSELDVLIDNYLIMKTKICKLMAFGIEPICAYFYNKFMEIKNVRVLLKGKESNYSTDEIRKRMRISYEL